MKYDSSITSIVFIIILPACLELLNDFRVVKEFKSHIFIKGFTIEPEKIDE